MKKPILLLFSDTHLFEQTSKYKTPFHNNFDFNQQLFAKAIELADEYGVEKIVHLGDVFDFKKAQPLSTLIAFEQILNNFSALDKKLFIIPGNHDKVDETSDYSYLTTFAHHKGIELIDSPTIYKSNKGINLYFLPYYSEELYNEELESLVNEPIKGKKVLLTHQSFNGINDNESHIIDNSINVDDKFDAIFSGHIHKRNDYVLGKPHYIGSAMGHNYGEYEQKGFTILYDDLSIEFIPFHLISYVTIPATAKNVNKVYDLAISAKESGDMVRIKFVGTEQEKELLKSYDWDMYGIKVIFVNSTLHVNNETDLEFHSEDVSDLKTMFDAFAKEKKINNYPKAIQYLNDLLTEH